MGKKNWMDLQAFRLNVWVHLLSALPIKMCAGAKQLLIDIVP
jgi:hypothetical protein